MLTSFSHYIVGVKVTAFRRQDRFCNLNFGPDWGRQDYEGCFYDPKIGNPYKSRFGDSTFLCNDWKPSLETRKKLNAVASMLGEKLGVFMRIDMYVSPSGDVWLSEFTHCPQGMYGPFHCFSGVSVEGSIDNANGDIDHCYVGKIWRKVEESIREETNGRMSNFEHGRQQGIPDDLSRWFKLTKKEQCEAVTKIAKATNKENFF